MLGVVRMVLAASAVAALLAGAAAAAGMQDDAGGPPVAKPPSPGQLKTQARMKQCGALWRADRAAGGIEAGMTWPKYLHGCNARLKAQG